MNQPSMRQAQIPGSWIVSDLLIQRPGRPLRFGPGISVIEAGFGYTPDRILYQVGPWSLLELIWLKVLHPDSVTWRWNFPLRVFSTAMLVIWSVGLPPPNRSSPCEKPWADSPAAMG